mmetsp:Transcript_13913/g.40976  ORF Transcript_13913/g.40976 Transcript_13913/m.40976 type:complete len:80 (-) Transcript_13913:7-246(-)
MVDAAIRVIASSISGIKARSCAVVVASCVESSIGAASIFQGARDKYWAKLQNCSSKVGGGAALGLNRWTQQLQGQGSVE